MNLLIDTHIFLWYVNGDERLNPHQIQLLPLTPADPQPLEQLPPLHKDPFDRMLVCQSLQNALILLTDDSHILQYPAHFYTP